MDRVNRERYREIIGGAAGKRILVVGDLMLDEFLWGKVSRISPEAPVPVVQVTGESSYPGGAANVARNLREFTPHVSVMGITGDDEYGQRLLELLTEGGIDVLFVERAADRPTTRKTRVIARQQQMVRVDRERTGALEGEALERFIQKLNVAVPEADAVIVADYGKGVVAQAVADELCRLAREHGRILTVDPNPNNPLRWASVTAINPTRLEAFQAAGRHFDSDGDAAVLRETGEFLLAHWNAALLVLTLGEQGMLLFQAGADPYPTPARAKEIFDVSGAGDTAIALLTLALAAGASPEEATEIANRASGVVVGKLGTATVTEAELADCFD